MLRHGRQRVLWDLLWLALCCAVSSTWCVTAATRLSATFDEPFYIRSGLEGWRTGSSGPLVRKGTMPLPVDVQTLPLFVWEWWRGQPLDLQADFASALKIARAGNLFFWWTLLAYSWLVANRIAGPWAGRLAVAWLACEPNLLGHAGLATTDIAISASLLALVYHFRTGRDGRWLRRVGVPAAFYALCLLTKASGLVFGPLCLFAVEVERLWLNGSLRQAFTGASRGGSGWRPVAALRGVHAALAPFRRDVAPALGIGLALAFVYCGSDWLPEPSFVAWAHGLPTGPFASTMIWVSEHLCLFTNAGEALVEQIGHGIRGHGGAYVLGQASPKPVWYYFPMAMAIKLSLPLLVAPVVLALAQRGSLRNWALLAAAALLVFSLNCRVQIGIRFMLPLVSMAIAGLAAAVIQAARHSSSPLLRRSLAGGALMSVIWTGVAACLVWPHGLCYANELWGGHERAYLYLSDSNYDWGQGLKELTAWQAEHDVAELNVWYFGSDPAMNEPPIRHLPLHAFPLESPGDVQAHLRGNLLAVGTTMLYGTYGLKSPAHQRAAQFLAGREPVARTTTFLIFDLNDAGPDPEVAQRALGEQRTLGDSLRR